MTMRRKRNRKPTHPGTILKEHYLLPLGLSISFISSRLGISRSQLSAIIKGNANISTNLALRLSRAFNTTPNLWINLQKSYELWCAEHESDDWKRVRKLPKLIALSG